MKIAGKVNEWNVLRDQFTVGTPIGDIKIVTGFPFLLIYQY